MQEYQHRAAECLRLANTMIDPKNKAILLEMAHAWSWLADQLRTKGRPLAKLSDG